MRVSNLSEVEINLVAMPEKMIKGKIYHISDIMDEETRSVEVLLECNNSNRLMKAGMYGTVRLTDKPSSAIVIPSSALLQEENSCYVLVAIGKNRYVKREVLVSTTMENKVVILSGLRTGEQIVTEGAFYLNDAR